MASPSGTIIRNQAVVRTAEVPNLLTDGDGNPSTGPEPTVVVVGNGQQLSIVKEVTVVGGGPASQGATLEYLVRVTNISLVPALYVVITDDLNMPVPGYLTYVHNSATLNGADDGHRRQRPASSPPTTRRPTVRCSRNRLRCCASAPSSIRICSTARRSRTPAR